MTPFQEKISDKRGGICFRVDDNQPIRKWTDFAEIFDAHGCKFSAAICTGRMAGDKEYIDFIRSLQARGHEIMDHTPLHSVDKLPLPPDADPDEWRTVPGVDHVDGELIYLSHEKIDTGPLQEGRADISGKRMVSRAPEELAEPNGSTFIAVYLPELGQAFRFEQAGDESAPVLDLQSFWGEDNADLGQLQNTVYHKLNKADVRMTLDARRLLAEASLNLTDSFGLRRPVTWIQPGSGGCSNFHRADVRTCFGDLYGYVAAATYPDRALKCYGEHDPDSDKAFGMQWGSFNDESKDLAWNKARIANGVALHHVLIGHSHFWEHAMPDGWDGYLRRVDGILAWCNQNQIPVKTYSEWAEILYHTKQDPAVNIFPGLDVDLDDDGVPDGYHVPAARLDRTDGVRSSNGVSLALSESGLICRVEKLAGLEKGAGEFTTWSKGGPGSSIEVTLYYLETGLNESLTFPASTPDWSEHRGSVTVPRSASQVDVAIECINPGGQTVKVTGISLRKATEGA